MQIKKIIFLICFLNILLLSASDVISVLSYNIRGYDACDSLRVPNSHWIYRQNHIIESINKSDADIVGIQEVFNVAKKSIATCNKTTIITGGYEYDPLIKKNIKNLLKKNIKIIPEKHLLRDYLREEMSRLGYKSFYLSEGSPKIIFYKSNKYVLVKGGHFYHDSFNKKSATFVILKNVKTGKKVFILNTHLVAGKDMSKYRKKSIKYIIKYIKDLNLKHIPIIIMGDFNIEMNSKEYSTLLKAMQKIGLIESFKSYKCTYNGFGNSCKKIDYIFHSKNLKEINKEIVKFVWNILESKLVKYTMSLKNHNSILFPSDHWPIKVIYRY